MNIFVQISTCKQIVKLKGGGGEMMMMITVFQAKNVPAAKIMNTTKNDMLEIQERIMKGR